MFSWFERRIDPYPTETPEMPPRSLVRFVLYYSQGAIPWLLLVAVTSSLIAIVEVVLFGWLGELIDQLSQTPRDQFWDLHGGRLAFMALVLLLVLPALNLLGSLIL